MTEQLTRRGFTTKTLGALLTYTLLEDLAKIVSREVEISHQEQRADQERGSPSDDLHGLADPVRA